MKWVHTKPEFEQENYNWVRVMQRVLMWNAQSINLHLHIKLTLCLWLAGTINVIVIWINTFYFQLWQGYKPFEVFLVTNCEGSSNSHSLLHVCTVHCRSGLQSWWAVPAVTLGCCSLGRNMNRAWNKRLQMLCCQDSSCIREVLRECHLDWLNLLPLRLEKCKLHLKLVCLMRLIYQ